MNRLIALQVRNLTDARIELDRFTRSTPAPAPGPAPVAYWSQRADLEEHARNMFDALDSAIRTYGRDD